MVDQLSDEDSCPERPPGAEGPLFHPPPARPIAADNPWCNNALRRKRSSPSRETTPPYPVSNRSERTSVTATARRRTGLQVVPGSIVLTVDRSRVARIGIQVFDAEKHRVGKAGSVRMG